MALRSYSITRAIASLFGNSSSLVSLNANNLAGGTVPATALGECLENHRQRRHDSRRKFHRHDRQPAPLDLRVNNARAIHVQPVVGAAPTIVGRSRSSNSVDVEREGCGHWRRRQQFHWNAQRLQHRFRRQFQSNCVRQSQLAHWRRPSKYPRGQRSLLNHSKRRAEPDGQRRVGLEHRGRRAERPAKLSFNSRASWAVP